MKKFKTYGKYKSKKDMNTDDWDEIKETKVNSSMYRNRKYDWDEIKKSSTLNKISYLEDSSVEICSNVESTSAEDESESVVIIEKSNIISNKRHNSLKKPCENEVCNIFKNLSLHDHSTPIFSSVSEKDDKSNSGTPVKLDSIQRKRLSSSEYSFTCKRSVSFLTSTKSFRRKTPCNYSSPLIHSKSECLAESPLSSSPAGRISFKDALTISTTCSEAEQKLLNLCDQDEILLLADVIDSSIRRKIGEGSYGEVFLKKDGQHYNAIKIVPVGDIEGQIRLNEIIPEMAISKKLSSWRATKTDNELYKDSCVEGFVQLKKLQFCKGQFPRHLVKLWEEWKKNASNDCQNEHPGSYNEDQLYVIFENKFGGLDLEKFKLKTMKEAISILKQLVATLASAERSLQFEHRDLHWGNILIGETDADKRLYILVDDEEYSIQSQGLTVSIIDFTLARLVSEDCVVFTDLFDEKELFEGSGDEQFDVYREMKEYNQNEWEPYNAYTNVLWILYITNKLISKLRKVVTLKKFASRILKYKSAYQLLTEDDFLK